jgi:hypothetical protein
MAEPSAITIRSSAARPETTRPAAVWPSHHDRDGEHGRRADARSWRDGLVSSTLLDPVVGVCRRTILAMFTLEARHPELRHAAWTREVFQESLGQLAGLDLAVAWGELAEDDLYARALESVLGLHDRTTPDAGLGGHLAIDMSTTVGMLMLPGTLGLLASGGTPFLDQPLTPEQVEALVREMERLIQAALDALAREANTPGARDALSRGRWFLDFLRASGRELVRKAGGAGGITVGYMIFWLKEVLAAFLRDVGRFVSASTLRAALARMLGHLPGIIGGGGGAGGAAAGSQAGAAFVPLLLVVLALVGGYALGRLIGQTKVGDQTVDEHVAEFIFLGSPFFESGRVPEGCKEAFEGFVKAWERRREFEGMGGPRDLILHFLQEEIDHLKFIIENRCTDDPGRWSRLRSQRMRLRDELAGK